MISADSHLHGTVPASSLIIIKKKKKKKRKAKKINDACLLLHAMRDKAEKKRKEV